MNGADGKHLFKTELGKFVHAFFRTARVHLVDRDQDGLAAAPQFFRHFPIQRHNAVLHVDDQNDDVGRLEGQVHLLHRRLDDDVIRLFAAQQTDAAGVHQRERTAMPFGLGADAIARHSRLIMNDGNAPADNAVEQSGFADIRPADDGN